MSDMLDSRSITRIREEFRPSNPLKTALNGFLQQPTDDIRFYTQAERIVPTDLFRGADYQQHMRAAEQRLRALGSHTVALASNVNILANEAGITLLFDVHDADRPFFDEATSALDEVEWENTSPSGLYVRFARSSLARDVERRREAPIKLLSRLRHPSAIRQMRVGDPHIVSRDVLLPGEQD